jgi:hypothetical protein
MEPFGTLKNPPNHPGQMMAKVGVFDGMTVSRSVVLVECGHGKQSSVKGLLT